MPERLAHAAAWLSSQVMRRVYMDSQIELARRRDSERVVPPQQPHIHGHHV